MCVDVVRVVLVIVLVAVFVVCGAIEVVIEVAVAIAVAHLLVSGGSGGWQESCASCVFALDVLAVDVWMFASCARWLCVCWFCVGCLLPMC